MSDRSIEPPSPTDRFEPVAGEFSLENAGLRALYRRWRDALVGDALPTKAFADPINLANHLGWLYIYDVEGPPLRFRYRLFASAMATHVGFDLTGKLIDEHPIPEVRGSIRHSLNLVIETAQPIRVQAERPLLGKRYRSEVLLLPLAGATGEIAHIICSQVVPPDMPRQWVLS